jgi:hypothetical protein
MNQANTVLGLLETLRELNARNAAQRDRVLNNAFPLMRARIQTLQLAGRENSTDPQTDASLTDALNMFERPNTAPLERFERLGITLGSLITSTSFGQQPKALSLLRVLFNTMEQLPVIREANASKDLP